LPTERPDRPPATVLACATVLTGVRLVRLEGRRKLTPEFSIRPTGVQGHLNSVRYAKVKSRNRRTKVCRCRMDRHQIVTLNGISNPNEPNSLGEPESTHGISSNPRSNSRDAKHGKASRAISSRASLHLQRMTDYRSLVSDLYFHQNHDSCSKTLLCRSEGATLDATKTISFMPSEGLTRSPMSDPRRCTGC